MITKDLGTFRWFGESWGAPCCTRRTRIPAPVGQPCELRADCLYRLPIEAEHTGVQIPTYRRGVNGAIVADLGRWHLECWLYQLGIHLSKKDGK